MMRWGMGCLILMVECVRVGGAFEFTVAACILASSTSVSFLNCVLVWGSVTSLWAVLAAWYVEVGCCPVFACPLVANFPPVFVTVLPLAVFLRLGWLASGFGLPCLCVLWFMCRAHWDSARLQNLVNCSPRNPQIWHLFSEKLMKNTGGN